MTPSPVSSNPILRRTLTWSAVCALVLAVCAAGIGLAVAGGTGAVSGLLGVLLAVVLTVWSGLVNLKDGLRLRREALAGPSA